MFSFYDSITQYFYPPTPPVTDISPTHQIDDEYDCDDDNCQDQLDTPSQKLHKAKPKVIISLKKFNMDQIQLGESATVIGRRNVGKSLLVADCLKKKQHFSTGLVINHGDSTAYDKSIDTTWIQEDLTTQLLTKFTEDCQQGQTSDPNFTGIMILEDFGTSDELIRSQSFENFILTNRPRNSVLFVTQQYAIYLKPKLRQNFDWVFICKEQSASNRKKLYEQYGSMFSSFDLFESVLKTFTKDFGCLVIHNTSNSDKLEDQVFYYRADLC
jgi:hypothetical protein